MEHLHEDPFRGNDAGVAAGVKMDCLSRSLAKTVRPAVFSMKSRVYPPQVALQERLRDRSVKLVDARKTQSEPESMKTPGGPIGKRLGTAMRRLVPALALCLSLAPVASAKAQRASQAASVSAITEISLERNCFGCPTASVLVLRRDGTATFTTTGSARSGAESKATRGSVGIEDFRKLALLAVSQGFFDLDDSYQDPQIMDGPSTTTGVARGSEHKRVFRRDEAGPASLKAIEAAIDAVKASIKFAS